MVICAGIDLSANPRRPSGLSIVEYSGDNGFLRLVYVGVVKENNEIIDLIKGHRVDGVGIDAPLSMPSEGRYYRKVDLRMIKAGYRVLPPAWRSMRSLTTRGMILADSLKSMGYVVIETHPRSCLKSSGCSSIEELFKAIGLAVSGFLTRDEIDSIIASIACLYHLLGNDLRIVDEDGLITLLPRICRIG